MKRSFTKQFKQLLEIGKMFKTDFIYVTPLNILGLNVVSNERMDKNNHIIKRCGDPVFELYGLYFIKDLLLIEKDMKDTKSEVMLVGMDILETPNVRISSCAVPPYLLETIYRFTDIVMDCNKRVPSFQCNLMENEEFIRFLGYKSADGGMMMRFNTFLITLFPGLLNVNKGDIVYLEIYDEPHTNQFITKFIIDKPKKKIIYDVFTRNIKLM